MSRLEEDGEECGDDEVGEPVERLADRHQSVLRVDRHDLRDDETFDVAHADREADDDERESRKLESRKLEFIRVKNSSVRRQRIARNTSHRYIARHNRRI